MCRIIEKTDIAPRVCRYVVEAPEIARKARAGQFVILRLDENGERIPLTIADMDAARGTLTLYVQAVGKTTLAMSQMRPGSAILDVAGPLGVPSRIEKAAAAVGVGGGFGIAALHPILREFTRSGSKTTAILGARSRAFLIMEEEMRRAADAVHIVTDDGSYGRQGLVSGALQEMLASGENIDLVIAIGPLPMMQAIAGLTRPRGIRTVASLNPIMIDGTGMCGACRVTVGGVMKFACVDGPEFDAHQVDFAGLMNRLQAYKTEEQQALTRYLKEHENECRLFTGEAGPS